MAANMPDKVLERSNTRDKPDSSDGGKYAKINPLFVPHMCYLYFPRIVYIVKNEKYKFLKQ